MADTNNSGLASAKQAQVYEKPPTIWPTQALMHNRLHQPKALEESIVHECSVHQTLQN